LKKFEFNLQPILGIKEQKEKIEKDKLAKLVYDLNLEKEKLNKLINEANKNLNQNYKELINGTKISKLIQYDTYLKALFKSIENQKYVINILQNSIEVSKKNLVEISKEKKALENLKEKKLEEFKYMQNIEYNNFVDEQISFKTAKSY